MLIATCHCKAIEINLHKTPTQLVDCNCSVCRRYASLWIHADAENLTFKNPKSETILYFWGDRNRAFHACKKCGCTTHWEGHKGQTGTYAVNARLIAPEDIREIPVRRFDGAKSWTFLD